MLLQWDYSVVVWGVKDSDDSDKEESEPEPQVVRRSSRIAEQRRKSLQQSHTSRYS